MSLGVQAAAQAQPVNDDFASGTVIAGPGSVAGTNVAATVEPGEPVSPAIVSSSSSVWWRYTPSVSQRVQFDTNGSPINTTLAVFTGASVGALTLIAENLSTNAGPSVLWSSLGFNAVAGTTYHIRVASFGATATGPITLTLTELPPLTNDDFANGLVIFGPGPFSGNNSAATLEPGEPNSPLIVLSDTSVWWRYTPPVAGTLTINTFGSLFDTTLAVFTGASVGALTLVANNDDFASRQSQVSFAASSGTTYHIRVAGWASDAPRSGPITLSLSGTAVTAPAASTGALTIVSGETRRLLLDADGIAPATADGTVAITDFAAATGEFVQGELLTFTLNNGVFDALVSNRIVDVSGSGANLNYLAGGVGANFVTFEVDKGDLDFDGGDEIELSNIRIRENSYTSANGDEINMVLTTASSTLNSVAEANRTYPLFNFADPIVVTIVPDGTNDLFDNVSGTGGAPGNYDGADSDGVAEISLAAGAFGELFDGPAAFADLGDLYVSAPGAVDALLAPVDLVEIDVDVTGPFSTGLAEIYLDDNACAGTVPMGGGALVAVEGVISGQTASFPTLPVADLPARPFTANVCVIADAATPNATVLNAGQYEAQAVAEGTNAVDYVFTGELDRAVYDGGRAHNLAYAFGDGAGYSYFVNVVTASATPVILLARDETGTETSGLLTMQQDTNTSALYTVADINAALGSQVLVDETTTAGLVVVTAEDATVGAMMLNPSGDLGAPNAYRQQ